MAGSLAILLPSKQVMANKLADILHQSIPNFVLKTINKQLNGVVDAKSVSFTAPTTITFKQITLKDVNYDTVIDIEKITINFSLLSLALGKIKANSVNVENPQFKLINLDGKLNLSEIFKSKINNSNTPSPIIIELGSVKISNGRLTWRENLQQKVVLENFNADGKIFIAPFKTKIWLNTMTSTNSVVSVNEQSLSLSSISAQNCYFQNEILEVGNFGAILANVPFNITGKIDFDHFKFALNSHTGAGKIFDFPVKSSQLQVSGNEKLIMIHSGTIKLEDNSIINPKGKFSFIDNHVDINAEVKNLLWSNLKNIFKIDLAAEARITGKVLLNGSTNKHETLTIQALTDVTDLKIIDLNLPSSKLELLMNFTAKENILFDKIRLTSPEFNLDSKGILNLQNNSINFNFDINAEQPHRFVKFLPPNLFAEKIKVNGDLNGQIANLQISSSINLSKITHGNLLINNLTGNLNRSSSLVSLENISGQLAIGNFAGHVSIGLKNGFPLFGTLNIKDIPLNQFSLPKNIAPLINGKFNGVVTLSGHINRPVVLAQTHIANLSIKPLFFNKINADVTFFDDQLIIKNLEGFLPYGRISTANMNLDFAKKTIDSELLLHNLNLGNIPELANTNISGIVSGAVKISNKLTNPQVAGDLLLNNIFWNEQEVGNGLAKVWFNKVNNLLQLSGTLAKDYSSVNFRSSLSVLTKQIRADIQLNDVNILPWTSIESSIFMPLKGNASGNVNLNGDFKLPKINAQLIIPNIERQQNIISDVKTATYSKKWVSEGPLNINAELNQGKLKMNLCGLSIVTSNQICTKNSRLKFDVFGNFTSLERYSLDLNAFLDLSELNSWFKIVKKEFSSFDTKLTIKAAVNKNGDKHKIKFSGDAEVYTLKLALPGSANIKLTKPVKIDFSNDHFIFTTPAMFSLASGDLFIDGSMAKSGLNLDLRGHIPLFFAKYFVPFFSQTDGLALGELKIKGSTQKPLLNGYLIPDPGSSVKPRSAFDDIIFNQGKIIFKSDTHSQNLTINFNQLDMTVGEGRASLDGKVVLNSDYQPETNLFTTWDIHLTGNEIMIREEENWVETDFDLNFLTKDNQDYFTGLISVSDGFLFKKFFLQNFIIASDKSIAPEFPKWLWPLKLNIKLNVNSFHAQGQMAAFFLDSYLTADLSLIGSLASPRIIGALEIAEGILRFPLLSFEIPTTTIPFRNTPGKLVDPNINILAYADLPRKLFNLSQDTNIQLSLTGSLEEMKLDLKTIAGDKSLDKTKLLIMLLGSSNFGVETLEDMLSSFTKTRILIGSSVQNEGIATQIQWQIGSRLEIFGSARTDATNISFKDMKIQLMLFDHLSFAKQLFLESTLFSPTVSSTDQTFREDLRLKLRLLEQ